MLLKIKFKIVSLTNKYLIKIKFCLKIELKLNMYFLKANLQLSRFAELLNE